MTVRGIKYLALVLLSVCSLSGCKNSEQQTSKEGTPGDLSRDSRYSAYRFDKTAGGVDIGVQPLSLPESPLGELLIRDAVLAREFAATGARYQIHNFFKGPELNFFLSRGDLEAGISGDIPTLTMAARGDIVIVAMAKQGYSSIISRQAMLTRDLKGKRIATVPGSTAHFVLLNALANDGLSEKDVTIVPMENHELPAALADRKVDAISTREPATTIALAGKQGFHLIHRGINMSFFYFRKDFVTSHPELARQILAAVVRACIWMRSPGNLALASRWSIESASRFQGSPYPLNPDRFSAIVKNDLLNIPAIPLFDERMLRINDLMWREFEFIKKNGMIPAAVSWDKIRSSFDATLLRQVLEDPKRYGVDRFEYRMKIVPVRETVP
ncbi:MAG TPA: ABC transporter substrate-binding protein [Desulfuromonadales bacterium]|nr:ABC transporter substrate-binding protein [Desulfuromonadales bacterium]